MNYEIKNIVGYAVLPAVTSVVTFMASFLQSTL